MTIQPPDCEVLMPYSSTREYADLLLTTDVSEVAPAGQFTLRVAAILEADPNTYDPTVEYRLFVLLPSGLHSEPATGIKSVVITSDGNSLSVPPSNSWTGGGEVSADITPEWDLDTGNDREKEAYKEWLLATWKSDLVDEDDRTTQTLIGWDIVIKVDSPHRYPANGVTLSARLIAKQRQSKKTASFKNVLMKINSTGPAFSSIKIPAATEVKNLPAVRPGVQSITLQAILAASTTAARMQIQWQVAGTGTVWYLVEPVEPKMISNTQLEDFTISYDFPQEAKQVSLQFRCADIENDNWGSLYTVTIAVVADLLRLDTPVPVIKVDSSSHIILNCVVTETSQDVKYADELQFSVDKGAHWTTIATKPIRSGAGPFTYTFTHDMTGADVSDRDFSQGVMVRAKDNLKQYSSQRVQFDAASFLTATWRGKPIKNNDINLGEVFEYAITLQCKLETILPRSTIYLLLFESAVEANATGMNFYLPDGVLDSYFAENWHGTFETAEFYVGPIRSGEIDAKCRLRSEPALQGSAPALLGNRLPAATLTIDSKDFVDPFTSTGDSKAIVFRPAPSFTVTHPASLDMLTNQNSVDIVAVFTPPIESVAGLVFNVTVGADNKTVTPVTETLTSNGFQLHLDPAVFRELGNNGRHNVVLAVHRGADARAAQRSTHSETIHVTINNTRPAVQAPKVEVVNDKLRVTGRATDPVGANDPVTRAEIYWDSTVTKQPQILTLTAEVGPPKRWAFMGELEIGQFTGTMLSPQLKVVTKGTEGEPLLEDLRFATAEGLFKVEMKILEGSVIADIDTKGTEVSDNGSAPQLTAGTVAFKVTVTSLVAMPQPLLMHIIMGEAFAGRVANAPAKTGANLTVTSQIATWNAGGSQILRTQRMEKGDSVRVAGTARLSKMSEANLDSFRAQNPDITLESAQTIAIAFTEPDIPPHTFRALKATDGKIFEAQVTAK